MATALISALTHRPVNRDVAMTGEITLRGRVLPVGGLKEKAMGALRARIKTIIIPEKNKRELSEIPAGVRAKINFITVATMDEVLSLALEPPIVGAKRKLPGQRKAGDGRSRTADPLPSKARGRTVTMNVLALDTAAQACAVALVEDQTIRAEMSLGLDQTHSRHLLRLIDMVLQAAGVDIAAIDAWAVGRGPGSFTGLRIGLSTVKGLAMATGKPVVAVSSLRALAYGAIGAPAWVCPMLDARKTEVYWALYRWNGGALERFGDENVTSLDQAIDQIAGPCLFIGSGAVRYQEVILAKRGPLAALAPPGHHAIRASALALSSWQRLNRGPWDPLETLAPRYLRGADARPPTAPKGGDQPPTRH
jgi:tRNA threonylcarbamoyladenosine biosynthesis protein TsaB